MKKLRLKALGLGATEILSREQLRSINGGCTDSSNCNNGWCDAGTCHPYPSEFGPSGGEYGSGGQDPGPGDPPPCDAWAISNGYVTCGPFGCIPSSQCAL